MSDLASAVGVLVAALDLALVRSITSAVEANLIAAGGVPGPLGTIIMPGPAPRGQTDSYEVGPREVIEPAPRFLPRLTHEPEPRVVDPGVVPIHPEHPSRLESPFEPVWKQLPPVEEKRTVTQVKYVHVRVDLHRKGTMLDIFV